VSRTLANDKVFNGSEADGFGGCLSVRIEASQDPLNTQQNTIKNTTLYAFKRQNAISLQNIDLLGLLERIRLSYFSFPTHPPCFSSSPCPLGGIS
jgi:hypothetical protein